MREGGGNCLKHFKRGWNRKEGSRSKDLIKRRDKLGQVMDALKREEESGTHLRNYDVYIYIVAGK